MEFNPGNNVVKRCVQGMSLEEKGNSESVKSAFPSLYSNIASRPYVSMEHL